MLIPMSWNFNLIRSTDQVVTLISEVTKKVQEHEPDTLIYYAFRVPDKNEIVIVER